MLNETSDNDLMESLKSRYKSSSSVAKRYDSTRRKLMVDLTKNVATKFVFTQA